ncbi:MAG: cysteine--tRNA ligase [Chloroflexi bacterium]|nr:cysteine--tRNA ligase [Chloroflexota bacterium]
MRLWNTLTRRKDTFTAGKVVRLYVCGITPYATTHLGHARTYVLFDVLIRELEHQGHAVRYVQNVTDVDDPLYARARDLGRTSADLAAEFTRVFQRDMAALGARPPDVQPRASEEIAEMQHVIARLLDRGHAYRRGAEVYFRVRSFPHYGELSKLDRAQMVALTRERGEDPADPRKEDPLDFLVWKPSQPDEDSWPSPWGRGRPGWHIECSAMALRYLGARLDIHGGGTDLIYPHHESEIAQSEASTGQSPFARFWVHVEMVRLGGIKMSKSLGNMVLVGDVLPRFTPAALRHYLLSKHYRTPLDYDPDDLEASAACAERLRRVLQTPHRAVDGSSLTAWQQRFDAALDDDLDTPAALEALDGAVQLTLGAPAGGTSDQQKVLEGMVSRLGLGPRQSDIPSNGTSPRATTFRGQCSDQE